MERPTARLPHAGVGRWGVPCYHFPMKPVRVLLVEDEVALHDAIKPYFEREGIELLSAFDGTTGLEAIGSWKPDLVILDVMLPGIDGFEILRQVRSQSMVPVIMLTARGDEIDRLLGLEMGADDYVSKPFSPRELVARVKAVWRRYERTSHSVDDQTPRLCEGLEVDTETLEARWQGKNLGLTKSEFLIVSLLASRPGRVFTRRELARELGSEYDIDDRTVDAHVKNIRKKITDVAGDPNVIETVRGFGYRLRRSA